MRSGRASTSNEYTHHLPAPQAGGQQTSLYSKHVGIRRLANGFAQHLLIATLEQGSPNCSQQVPRTIDHAHAACAQHALDQVPRPATRGLRRAVGLPGPGKGKVGQVAHDCTTTAVRLSPAVPRKTPANKGSRTRRISLAQGLAQLRVAKRLVQAVANRNTSPAKVPSSRTCGLSGAREPMARSRPVRLDGPWLRSAHLLVNQLLDSEWSRDSWYSVCPRHR